MQGEERLYKHHGFCTNLKVARALLEYRYTLAYEPLEELAKGCTKAERRQREQNWINLLKPSLNLLYNPYYFPLKTDAKVLVRFIAEQCIWYEGKVWPDRPKDQIKVPSWEDYFEAINPYMEKAGLPSYFDNQCLKWDLYIILTRAFGLKIGNQHPTIDGDWHRLLFKSELPPPPPPLPPCPPGKVRVRY